MNLKREFLKLQDNTNDESDITEFDSSSLTSIFGKNTVEEESEMSNAKTSSKITYLRIQLF